MFQKFWTHRAVYLRGMKRAVGSESVGKTGTLCFVWTARGWPTWKASHSILNCIKSLFSQTSSFRIVQAKPQTSTHSLKKPAERKLRASPLLWGIEDVEGTRTEQLSVRRRRFFGTTVEMSTIPSKKNADLKKCKTLYELMHPKCFFSPKGNFSKTNQFW